jgi:hypothetical protein
MPLTSAEMRNLKNLSPEFSELNESRTPRYVGGCDDDSAQPGDICFEANCVDGEKEVGFCNKDMDCKIVRIPC